MTAEADDGCPDPSRARIGLANRESMNELVDSFGLYSFTERLGMSEEQVAWLAEQARAEMQDRRLKLYIPLYV